MYEKSNHFRTLLKNKSNCIKILKYFIQFSNTNHNILSYSIYAAAVLIYVTGVALVYTRCVLRIVKMSHNFKNNYTNNYNNDYDVYQFI